MEKNNRNGVLALVAVTIIAFGVIIGSRALTTEQNEDVDRTDSSATQKKIEELNTRNAEGIDKAVKNIGENGEIESYEVTVITSGYGGNIKMEVVFDKDCVGVLDVKIIEQTETEGVGSKITEAHFLNQFAGSVAPIALKNSNTKMADDKMESANVLKDGYYRAEASEPKDGFTDTMSMTIIDGKITEVVWDGMDAEGNSKRLLSEKGAYKMTEDGKTWKEQAEALATLIIEHQSLDSLELNEEGKTDAVAGVSISLYGFVGMVEQCLSQAVSIKDIEMDSITGASISSKAVVDGINKASTFLKKVAG